MSFGFSGESFVNLLVLSTIIAILIVFIVFYCADKKGIDINSRFFQLKIGITCAFIFVIIPLCLSDLDMKWKLIGSILSLTAGVGNYFGIDKIQMALKEQFGSKDCKK